jgi:hypothetical protein
VKMNPDYRLHLKSLHRSGGQALFVVYTHNTS